LKLWRSRSTALNKAGYTIANRITTSSTHLNTILERHTPRLLALEGVLGAAEGQCAGKPCILVLVEQLTPSLRQAIPPQLEGIPVEIRETGCIETGS